MIFVYHDILSRDLPDCLIAMVGEWMMRIRLDEMEKKLQFPTGLRNPLGYIGGMQEYFRTKHHKWSMEFFLFNAGLQYYKHEYIVPSIYKVKSGSLCHLKYFITVQKVFILRNQRFPLTHEYR